MNDYVIELNKVSCKAGYRYLLKDITWQVKPGEHWVVFGMNGSGKTTLLSVIAGFRHYTDGDIKVLGENFCNENILNIRRRIGWVSASFFDKYYTKESALHIVLSGKNGTLGLDANITLKDVRLAKDLLMELQLEDKINRPFDMLSKGERQNVLIARAMFSNPDILILDEPCTGLDVYNRSYLFETIKALSKKKDMTIIYVTHYVEEIIPLFQKTLLLKNGHVFAKGDTPDLFTEPMICELLGYPVTIKLENDGIRRMHVETKSALTNLLMRGDI
jgi:iron complex transport system ATP-binding protein